ncbi:MAG: alpha/beta hydrolase, partial [Comamonadaceae bacterium]|nr:alpha/beta hydrolase [Comamonadaceae bacterium]
MLNRKDPDWLGAQYDNRARVPGHAAIFARWAQASALVRGAAPCALDLRYGEGEGATLDVFPAGAAGTDAGAPVLIFIHGDDWRSLDKSDFSFVAPSFTADGALVVVPNYTLCPHASIEQQALQMTQLVAWIAAHAAAHGGDASRLALVGHSAGGHLAAMLLCCRWKDVGDDLPPRLVAGALSISGVFDLEPVRNA